MPGSSKISKFMSLILRHDPATIGLQLDAAGWAVIDGLLAGKPPPLSGHGLQVLHIRQWRLADR